MLKLWVKILKGEKIIKQFTYTREEKLVYSQFLEYLMDICNSLDIPTPVLLKTHIFNLAKFSMVKFKQRDFVESIDFDFLVIENVSVSK